MLIRQDVVQRRKLVHVSLRTILPSSFPAINSGTPAVTLDAPGLAADDQLHQPGRLLLDGSVSNRCSSAAAAINVMAGITISAPVTLGENRR
jgi:hypothetical protein